MGILSDPISSPVPLRLNTLGTTSLGTGFLGWGPAASPLPPAPIFSPHREWAGWLSGVIGREVQLGRIAKNTKGPRVCYNVVHLETPTYLIGPCRLSKYSVQVDALALDPDAGRLILETIFVAMARSTGRGFLDVAIPGDQWSKLYPQSINGGQGSWGESREWDL